MKNSLVLTNSFKFGQNFLYLCVQPFLEHSLVFVSEMDVDVDVDVEPAVVGLIDFGGAS